MAADSKGKKKSLFSLDAAYLEAVQEKGEPKQAATSPLSFEQPREKAGGHPSTTPAPLQDPWQDIEVLTTVGGMEAKLHLPVGYQFTAPLPETRILAGLREMGIVHGIDQAAVVKTATLSRTSGNWSDDLVVARGTPAASSEIRIPILKRIGKTDRPTMHFLENFTFPAWDLEKAFTNLDLNSLSRLDQEVAAVAAGEDLAVREAGGDEPGRNIFGKPCQGEEIPFTAGPNVALDSSGSRWRAFTYGYLLYRKGILSVIQPLWISPDRLEAYFILLPQTSPAKLPNAMDLERLLILQGVKASFIRRETLDLICDKLPETAKAPAAIKIAEGIRPVPGEAARVTFFFDSSQKAGALREDDTIDLRERDLVINAEKGQVLAEKIPANKGRRGLTLDEKPLPAPDGQDVAIEAGKGVQVIQEEDRLLFVAKQDGVIIHGGRKITVAEMYHINGDVDYGTGNIDVAGNLHLTGSVCAGFSVRAGGSIIIEGAVEAGASVRAEEDLVVKNGIIGEATTVIALGDLRTMFIQDAQVMVRGDAWVGSYIFNGQVRIAGKLFVQRGVGTRGGRVVGGVVCAADGVEVSTVGSPTNQNTLVALQTDPQLLLQLDELGRNIKLANENITKILRTLNLQEGDLQAIRRLLAGTPPERRKQYLDLIVHLRKLLEHKRTLQEDRSKLQEQLEKGLKKARIKITGELFQGNRVQIGSRVYVVEHDMGPSEFRLENDSVLRN